MITLKIAGTSGSSFALARMSYIRLSQTKGGLPMTDRRILSLSGADVLPFLQNLVTNDVDRLSDGLVYTALLTPQGKYLADFFLARGPDGVLLDVDAGLADGLQRRLTMYRLRSDVTIGPSGLNLQRGTGPAPDGAMADPRHPALGWRRYSPEPAGDDGTAWDAVRGAHTIPHSGIGLTPGTLILAAGVEGPNGAEFRARRVGGDGGAARRRRTAPLGEGS